jgi:OCT family organic cation transporter-like MFS transporter 4/5
VEFDLAESVWNTSIPFNHAKNEFSKCEFYNETKKFECTEYVWNTTEVKSSAVKDFTLVCDRAPMRASADSFMMVGVMIGSYVFGDLSDRFGRKPTFILSLVIQVVFGLLTAVAPEFISYTICRMVRDIFDDVLSEEV